MNKLFSLGLLLVLSCSRPAADDTSCNGESCAPTTKPPKPVDADVAPAVRVPIDGLPSFGQARAPVTIVAFTDYECPYCAKADETVNALVHEYGDRIRVVVASRPLPIHEHASSAATAFLAAAEQGKGEAMHRRLFAQPQKTFDDDALHALAAELGVDLAAFDRARATSAKTSLAQSMQLADRLAVRGTPTFFVNGRRIVGAQPIDTFRSVVEEELKRGGPPANLPEYVEEKPKEEPVRTDVVVGDAPVRGPERAPVSVVFFSDFECPYCERAEKTLRDLEAAHPGEVKVAFRHKPLPMHPHARLAAKASIAASMQRRFWEYHDVLVAHRQELSREDMVRYAAEVGLDVARFERDLDGPAVEARLAEDERQAEALEVRGTPTSFVNGQRVAGAQPLAAFQNAVTAALKRAAR